MIFFSFFFSYVMNFFDIQLIDLKWSFGNLFVQFRFLFALHFLPHVPTQ